MDEDLPLNLTNVKDDDRYQQGGKLAREKLYTFYLGDHGPFSFRTPRDPFDEQAFPRYVDTLRAHLRTVARS